MTNFNIEPAPQTDSEHLSAVSEFGKPAVHESAIVLPAGSLAATQEVRHEETSSRMMLPGQDRQDHSYDHFA